MNTIIDITTNKKYSVFSKKGKQILKSYIKLYNKYKLSGGTATNTATTGINTTTATTIHINLQHMEN